MPLTLLKELVFFQVCSPLIMGYEIQKKKKKKEFEQELIFLAHNGDKTQSQFLEKSYLSISAAFLCLIRTSLHVLCVSQCETHMWLGRIHKGECNFWAYLQTLISGSAYYTI